MNENMDSRVGMVESELLACHPHFDIQYIMFKFAIMIEENIQEGFFERYFMNPLFRGVDSKGRDRRGGLKYVLLAWLIVTLGIVGLLLGLVGLFGPEVGFICLSLYGVVWLIFSGHRFVVLSRGAGNSGEKGDFEESVKPVWLLIDKLMVGVSILFLILGILMAVTTLYSGDMDISSKGSGEPSSKMGIERNEVEEEPIFTYQNEAPAVDLAEDEFVEFEEVDTVSLEESYDPSVPVATSEEADTLSLEF